MEEFSNPTINFIYYVINHNLSLKYFTLSSISFSAKRLTGSLAEEFTCFSGKILYFVTVPQPQKKITSRWNSLSI